MNTHILEIGGQSYPLKWSIGAQFRAEALTPPVAFVDLADPHKEATALVGLAWAMLPQPSPINFAAFLSMVEDTPNAGDLLDGAVAQAWRNANPKAAEAIAAKKVSTDSSPAPESSSVSASQVPKSKHSTEASGTPLKLQLRERN